MGIAETLAKDLRDLENDGASGKRTTSVHVGNRVASAASFVFSMVGISLWAYPFLFVHDTHLVLKGLMFLVYLSWTAASLFLCISLYKGYTKSRARELHVSYLLTLTSILAITFVAGVS
jgi:1,4-dihydroxy-2-naphthoate octaprenyltransferase